MDAPLRQTTGIFETVNGQMRGGGGGGGGGRWGVFYAAAQNTCKRSLVVVLDIKQLLQFAECILLCF